MATQTSQTIDKEDILIIIYPNVNTIEGIFVLDPYDKNLAFMRLHR
jgi:hypothetical protein